MNYLAIVLMSLIFSNSCGPNQKKAIVSHESSEKIVQVEIINTVETPKHVETTNRTHTNSELSNIKDSATKQIQQEVIRLNLEGATNHLKIASFDHSLWNELLQKHVSNKGIVNYKGFIGDLQKLDSYLALLSANPPKETWSKAEKLAYWINVYNAFTVKLILNNYPVKSIKDISSPWGQRFFIIGDEKYSLNNVEHGIIRKMDEPRIHFALVCAAISCPRLYNKAFTAGNLDKDLTKLTKGFLSDPSKNNLTKDNVVLSRIFKWYSGDFNNDGSLIDFLNRYSAVAINEKANIDYKDYNWNLNE